MKQIFNFSIKSKIIVIFSAITIVLVLVMARMSYLFVREIYLQQIEQQVLRFNINLSKQIDLKFLDFIEPENDNLARRHYKNFLIEQADNMQLTGVFLFNNQFEILVSTDEPTAKASLLINRKEIRELQNQSGTASLPFKGSDEQWYLWGFYRLDDRYFIGIQENALQFARLEHLSFLFLLIGSAGVALTILAGWLVARTIARPIDRMVRFSARIGQGQFNSKAPENISGELAILKDSLVKMSNGLAARQEEKEKILAQIAHEIRNPLGGIELLSGLIKEDLPPESSAHSYAGKILGEVQGLKEQITAYLNFSKPAPAVPENISFRQLADEISESQKPILNSKQIQLDINGRDIELKFDRGHLRQILTNLINNSIEAMSGPGIISLAAERNGRQTTISLGDEGPGIADEDLDKIFDPFFSRRSDGTGLGLSICRKLCEENHSQLTVFNGSDKGCTFLIRINESI